MSQILSCHQESMFLTCLLLHQNVTTVLSCNWNFCKSAHEHSVDPSGHGTWTCGLHFIETWPCKNIFAARWTKPQLLQSVMSRSTCAFFFPFIWPLHFLCCQSVTLLVNYSVQISVGLLCSDSIDVSTGKKSWGEENCAFINASATCTCNVTRRTTRWKSLLIKSWAFCFYHLLFRFMNVIWFLWALWTFIK